MNNTVIDIMNRECIYNNLDLTSSCPVWAWVALGVVILGLIGVTVWIFKNLW